MSPKEIRQREWAARVATFKASGLKLPQWCSTHDLDLEQMKYWVRKLKKSTDPSPATTPPASFIPLTTVEHAGSSPKPSSLDVRIGSVHIELQPGFDPRLLREVVEALSLSC